MKKLWIWILIIILAIGGVWFYRSREGKATLPAVTTEQKKDKAAASVEKAVEDVGDAAKAVADDVKKDVENAGN